MRILITGAAGFIGSNLSESLIKSNYIVGIDNFDPFYSRTIKEDNLKNLTGKDDFSFYEMDLLDLDKLDEICKIEKIETIIHLAAKAGVRPSILDPVGYTRHNVEATINILESARRNGIKNIILASSSSVYGNNSKVPFSEEDNVDFPISPYAASKKSCELFSHSFAKLHNQKIAALRFFTVYGRRQRPDLAIAKFTRMIDNGEPIPFYGDGTTERDYTYIDDITDGIKNCMDWLITQDGGCWEVFNLGENQTTTLSSLVKTIEEALGRKAVFDKQPMQPGDVKRTFANIDKAKRTFAYSPKTQIKEGIIEYIKYYRSI
ncbi:MAG: GDP-mannose 4,6-dehydratase [Spirochaetia bacterium]|jgi:UDP-glucuronate 4-epimerase|nr:GDP-mannose 4,6-dehydratase [Spirochaetia bacterium]